MIIRLLIITGFITKMIISNYKKFIGVCVAKTGSTTLRRIFGHPPPDPPPEIYHMHLKDILLNHSYAKDYYKFGFVRDPYHRLHSIYCDFKFSQGHFWAHAIKNRKSFEDFILNIEGSIYADYIHMRPQVEYLETNGAIELDFLGRYENYESDCRKLLSILDVQVEEIPKLRNSPKKEPCFYTDEMKEVMQRVYSRDFEVFGYDK